MHKTTPTRNERALIYFSESVITIGHESMNNGKLNFLRMCNSADEAATTPSESLETAWLALAVALKPPAVRRLSGSLEQMSMPAQIHCQMLRDLAER
jgi:hypothetical protein